MPLAVTFPALATGYGAVVVTVLIVCTMRIVKSLDLIRDVTAAGWVLDRVRGSHHVFKHPVRPGHVVIPHPKKDLGIGLVAAIRKQAGLQER